MTARDFNGLPAADFVRRYGALFEHSSWVVERAAALRPFDDLHEGLMRAVYTAGEEEQLALICAHPELAGKAAIAGNLTEASAAEQAGAGLDRLTREEYARFHALNAAYRESHGFPFVICVRLTDKAGILAAMEARAANPPQAEIAAALAEIGKIVKLRLEDMP